MSVYVPPQLHRTTLKVLGDMFLGLPHGTTIIGGDFNALLNREIDSSRGVSGRESSADQQFHSSVYSMGLCNVWRKWNPSTPLYTHTSAAHHMHSRIDYILMSATDMSLTKGDNILPRGISDHSPVITSMHGS